MGHLCVWASALAILLSACHPVGGGSSDPCDPAMSADVKMLDDDQLSPCETSIELNEGLNEWYDRVHEFAFEGLDIPDVHGDVDDRPFKRLHHDPRTAVVLEAWYAINPAADRNRRRQNINGWTVGEWNYLNSDQHAYNHVKNWFRCCSSLWSRTGRCPTWGCANWVTQSRGDSDFYSNPGRYGMHGGIGRGGQCMFFAALVMYRSGVRFHVPGVALDRMIPSYSQARNDFYGPRRYTKPATQARPGDILISNGAGNFYHTAIAVEVLDGVAGHDVRMLDVIDANTDFGRGANQEMIGLHVLWRHGAPHQSWDLDNYLAIDLDRVLTE